MRKKLLSLFTAVCLLTALVLPANVLAADEADEGFARIYCEGSSPTVKVYENIETGEKYATYDPQQFSVGDDVILYSNPETGERVGVEIVEYIPPITTRTGGDSGWSGGYIPGGTTTLKPHASVGTAEVSYYVIVNAYPVTYLDAYNASYSEFGWTTTSSNLFVGRAVAGDAPAYATYQYTAVMQQLGVVIKSKDCYLTSQMNYYGQHRITWNL
jgi:hypothetical protein